MKLKERLAEKFIELDGWRNSESHKGAFFAGFEAARKLAAITINNSEKLGLIHGNIENLVGTIETIMGEAEEDD